MTIYTHINPDLDAVFSVAAFKLLRPEYHNVQIQLVPANWDGDGFADGDIALDIKAGGKGFKGVMNADTGRMGSAFEGVIRMYGQREDQEYFSNLVTYIDAEDGQGTIGLALGIVGDNREKINQFLTLPDLRIQFSIWKELYSANIPRLFEVAYDYLSGYREVKKKEQLLHREVDLKTQFFAGGKIAYTTTVYTTVARLYLFNKGVDWVVYAYDNCLGLKRNENVTLRADHPLIRAVVEKYGEQDEWFAHSAGFLYCRGSTKAPVATPSKVDPMELVRALEQLVNV